MPENAKPASLNNIAFDTGVLMERQRIIKLLENDFYHFKEITPAIYKNGVLEVKGVVVCADDCSGCDLIALIKAED